MATAPTPQWPKPGVEAEVAAGAVGCWFRLLRPPSMRTGEGPRTGTACIDDKREVHSALQKTPRESRHETDRPGQEHPAHAQDRMGRDRLGNHPPQGPHPALLSPAPPARPAL